MVSKKVVYLIIKRAAQLDKLREKIMTQTPDIFVVNYQPHLLNEDYLKDAIESDLHITPSNIDTASLLKVSINDLSITTASGYGSWKTTLTIEIGGAKKKLSSTHHNENWYYSQKTVYDNSLADSEGELKEAYASFQAAFESVIDNNINSLSEACLQALEETED